MNFNIYDFANDLHQKGDLKKIEAMNNLADRMESKTNLGLAGAFVTNGVFNEYDAVAMIANKKEYEDETGYVLYSNKLNKPIFLKDSDLGK